MHVVFVPFDWTRALSPVCFWSVHNSMNFCMPELHLFITTTLECSGDVVIIRVSMKNDKTGKVSHWRIIRINRFFSGVHACVDVPMHSQTLHKHPSDIYSVCECISTIYTCMNSWKEGFNPIMNCEFSIWYLKMTSVI